MKKICFFILVINAYFADSIVYAKISDIDLVSQHAHGHVADLYGDRISTLQVSNDSKFILTSVENSKQNILWDANSGRELIYKNNSVQFIKAEHKSFIELRNRYGNTIEKMIKKKIESLKESGSFVIATFENDSSVFVYNVGSGKMRRLNINGKTVLNKIKPKEGLSDTENSEIVYEVFTDRNGNEYFVISADRIYSFERLYEGSAVSCYDLQTEKEIFSKIHNTGLIGGLNQLPDKSIVYFSGFNGYRFDFPSGQIISQFNTYSDEIKNFEVVNSDLIFCTRAGKFGQINLESGIHSRLFEKDMEAHSFAVSNDKKTIAIVDSKSDYVYLYDLIKKEFVSKFSTLTPAEKKKGQTWVTEWFGRNIINFYNIKFSADGKKIFLMFTGYTEGGVNYGLGLRIINLANGQIVDQPGAAFDYSNSLKYLLLYSQDNDRIEVLNDDSLATKFFISIKGLGEDSFLPSLKLLDGGKLLSVFYGNKFILVDLIHEKYLSKTEITGNDIWISDCCYSNGTVYFSTYKGAVYTHDIKSNKFSKAVQLGKDLIRLNPYKDMIICNFKDGSFSLLKSDFSIKLCDIFFSGKSDWVIIGPNNYFDTNDLDRYKGLHWIANSKPMEALDLEIFMKEFYEPNIFKRIISGEDFSARPNISQLNRLQPIVQILSVTPNGDDKVNLQVLIKNSISDQSNSEIHNLRVFRDGQLVAYAPEDDGKIDYNSLTNEAIISFNDIKIPHVKGMKEIEFSAYAFNVDGIKSSTSRVKYKLPKELPPRKGNAYIVSIGVNAYENPQLDLKFAVNDAKVISKTLQEKLKLQKEKYDEIIPILIISDSELVNNKREVTINDATKDNIKAIFNALSSKSPKVNKSSDLSSLFSKYSGKDAASNTEMNLNNFSKLKPANPEDLIIISFSSHGYVDKKGTFYILQNDTGKEKNEALTKSINTDDLTKWLRDIDAGDIVMIIDACHSAASVQGEGFKPGPMGSRGLGQLAFNKGMKILTSTNSNDVALESEDVKHGYLTYALVQEGLALNMADFMPKDNKVSLVEWLKYGSERVPKLHAEINAGTFDKQTGSVTKTRAIQLTPETTTKKTVKEGGLQQPNLFNFSKNKSDEIIYTYR